METDTPSQHFHCPITATLSVLGGKWAPQVLWELRDETLRFGELQCRIPGITKKMLSQRLQELEEDGVVHREAYAEVPPRVEYSLTAFGKTLRPVLDAMCEWGNDYLATTEDVPPSESPAAGAAGAAGPAGDAGAAGGGAGAAGAA